MKNFKQYPLSSPRRKGGPVFIRIPASGRDTLFHWIIRPAASPLRGHAPRSGACCDPLRGSLEPIRVSSRVRTQLRDSQKNRSASGFSVNGGEGGIRTLEER